MREHKYKFWLPEFQTMIDENFEGNDILEEDSIIITGGTYGFSVRLWDIVDTLENGEHIQEYDYVDYNDFVVLQYTGLKDRNDVEIYEGDYLVDDEGFGVVEFKNGSWMYDGDHLFDFNYEGCELRVVGNIYEKPELLED